MTVWYEESFGCEYLELYAHRDVAEAQADVEAIVRLLGPPKDEPLLDLCCGACRHVLILRELGFTDIVGLDLSEELLQVGSQELVRAGAEGAESSSSVRLVHSDMRSIPYQDYFATVLSLFTSFGYFEQDAQNQAVFEAVYEALKRGGQFLIDYMNREHVIANLVERDEKVLPGRRVYNFRCLTEGCQRVEKSTTVVTDAGETREFHESVRLYSRDEMVDMLTQSGFVDIRTYGSLEGQPYELQSPRLVVVAQKG
jgi:ubiquinone/menaquinone biosynthesis C-methylase UbiE